MNKHEPCVNCGSTERTPWLHAKVYSSLRMTTPYWPKCYRYCRGCSTLELMAHKDHRKEVLLA